MARCVCLRSKTTTTSINHYNVCFCYVFRTEKDNARSTHLYPSPEFVAIKRNAYSTSTFLHFFQFLCSSHRVCVCVLNVCFVVVVSITSLLLRDPLGSVFRKHSSAAYVYACAEYSPAYLTSYISHKCVDMKGQFFHPPIYLSLDHRIRMHTKMFVVDFFLRCYTFASFSEIDSHPPLSLPILRNFSESFYPLSVFFSIFPHTHMLWRGRMP